MNSEHREGDVIGAYRVEGVIGSGGMGWVYRAVHALSERVVALKIQRSDAQTNARARDRMLREAQILATLAHPGVPAFHEVGLLDDGRPWIAMELVEGIPLATRLRNGPIDADEAASIVTAVASVLAAAHDRGLTHRDLKPDNIFLTPDAAYPVRVLDWGIAHDLGSVRLTNHDEAIGTPTYMSPEQARGGPFGGHCDVYGLGVIAYHMLSGEPPFVGNNPVEILLQHFNKPPPSLGLRCPEVSIGLVELVERMLSKLHDGRPRAHEIDRELRATHADYDAYDLGGAVPAQPSSTEQVTTRFRVRS
ncbi:MAG TPA: serine/threonine-protein kinase [Kofleriaceae bacterium]